VSSGIIISAKAENRPPLVVAEKVRSNPNPVGGKLSSVNFFDGLSGVAIITLRKQPVKFCQGDWENIYDEYARPKYDKSGDSTDAQGNKVYYTVADKGCALTCLAMVARAGGADTDPGKLADELRQKKAFTDVRVQWASINGLNGNTGYRYKDTIEGKGLRFKKDNVTVDLDRSVTVDLSKMDQYLAKGDLIVAQVYNPTTHNNHWVLVTDKQGGNYRILDPGCYEGRNDLGSYDSNVYEFVVYFKKPIS
jgi:Peptidase_C39 like family